MATVIDSLVVAIGLDTTNLRKGQQEAQDAVKKTGEGVKKAGDAIERKVKTSTEAVNKLTVRFLELFAVLAGASGLKSFTQDLIQTNAQLGLFSANVQQSPQYVQGLINAVERVSHSTEGARASIQAVGKELNAIVPSSGFMEALGKLQGRSGVTIDWQHGMQKFLSDVAEAEKKMDALGHRGEGLGYAQGLGIDESTFNLLVKGAKALNDELAKSQTIGIVSPADVKAANDLATSFDTIKQTFFALGNDALPHVQAALKPILDDLRQWAKTDGPAFVKGLVEGFAGIVKDVSSVLGVINQIVDATTGWKNLIEGAMALWSAAKFVSILSSMASMVAMSATLAANMARAAVSSEAATGAGLGGFLRLAGMWATLASLGGDTNKPDPTADDYAKAKAAENDYQARHGSFWQQMSAWWNHDTTGGYAAGNNAGLFQNMRGRGIFGGARATGGPVSGGSAYTVGEHGQETFVPGESGSIIPNLDRNGFPIRVNGGEVSHSNPLPVTMMGGASGGGSSFWDTVKSFFGGGSGTADSPSPGGFGSIARSISSAIGAVAPGSLGADKLAGYKQVYEAAKAAGDKFPEVTAGQWAVESSWGTKPSGKNNFFGQTTDGILGHWKNYDTPEEGLADHLRRWSGKYGDAKTPEEAIRNLVRSGYTPDAGYAELVDKARRMADATPSALAKSSTDFGGLRILPGHGATAGGAAQIGLIDVAKQFQALDPNLQGFTALNDGAHAFMNLGSGPYGAHGQGRAFDAVSRDIEASKQVLRNHLSALGMQEGSWPGTNGDYSIEPGDGGGTGPHLHFQWNSNAAAARYVKVLRNASHPLLKALRTPHRAIPRGAGASALTSMNYHHNPVSNSSAETHIGAIHVNTQATDAQGISSSIGSAVKGAFSPHTFDYGLA